MFSPVRFAARLSSSSAPPGLPGLRKSFCRSVTTSTVRGRSTALPVRKAHAGRRSKH